jgi:hypothetical protein
VDDLASRLDDLESRVDDVESTVADICDQFPYFSGALSDIYYYAC